MVQISNVPSQVFSVVEHLTLGHDVHSQSSEEHNAVDWVKWHDLFRSFSNVKDPSCQERACQTSLSLSKIGRWRASSGAIT